MKSSAQLAPQPPPELTPQPADDMSWVERVRDDRNIGGPPMLPRVTDNSWLDRVTDVPDRVRDVRLTGRNTSNT